MSARGLHPLTWYIDGVPLPPDDTGDVNWFPKAEGFYTVSVTDAEGHTAKSHVRVVSVNGSGQP